MCQTYSATHAPPPSLDIWRFIATFSLPRYPETQMVNSEEQERHSKYLQLAVNWVGVPIIQKTEIRFKTTQASPKPDDTQQGGSAGDTSQ